MFWIFSLGYKYFAALPSFLLPSTFAEKVALSSSRTASFNVRHLLTASLSARASPSEFGENVVVIILLLALILLFVYIIVFCCGDNDISEPSGRESDSSSSSTRSSLATLLPIHDKSLREIVYESLQEPPLSSPPQSESQSFRPLTWGGRYQGILNELSLSIRLYMSLISQHILS